MTTFYRPLTQADIGADLCAARSTFVTLTTNSRTTTPTKSTRTLLNKVPEVVIWFWIIKVLCTTVGESFADWINETLGVGLVNTVAALHGRARRRAVRADAPAALRARSPTG